MLKMFLIMVAVVVLGWTAYGLWQLKIYLDEKKRPEELKGEPREKSKKLQEAEQSFEDFAKQMEGYKRKPFEKD